MAARATTTMAKVTATVATKRKKIPEEWYDALMTKRTN